MFSVFDRMAIRFRVAIVEIHRDLLSLLHENTLSTGTTIKDRTVCDPIVRSTGKSRMNESTRLRNFKRISAKIVFYRTILYILEPAATVSHSHRSQCSCATCALCPVAPLRREIIRIENGNRSIQRWWSAVEKIWPRRSANDVV